MTVQELMEELENCPPDMCIIDAYLDDINGIKIIPRPSGYGDETEEEVVMLI